MNCCDKTNLKTFEGCSYKGLSPFKYFCLTAFPYIEADFDALTNYELLCKIVEYLNNTRSTVNNIGQKTEELCIAFNQLKTYVDTFFDNLDIQEEVNNYMDDLVESGAINDIIREALTGTLVDISLYRPFAKILSDPSDPDVENRSLFAQGMAIGVINDRPVIAQAFTDDTADGNNNIISFVYMDTGVYIGTYNIPSGHCNSMCFNPNNNHFYIACGGGNSTLARIVEIDIAGNTVNIYNDFPNTVYQIAHNKESFFVTMSGGIFREYSEDFTTYKDIEISFEWGSEFTTQSLTADDLYLYFPVGNTIHNSGDKVPKNFVYVYTHDGTFYKRVEMRCPFEIEQIAFYNEKCYAACNVLRMSYIFEVDMYIKSASGYLSYTIPNGSQVNYAQTIYIDESYVGFFVNPEDRTKPLNSPKMILQFLRENATEVTVSFLSDAISKEQNLSIFYFPLLLRINGNNHKIGRLNINAIRCSISNFILTSEDAAATLLNFTGERLYLSNIQIGESDSENNIAARAMEIHCSSLEATGIVNYKSTAANNNNLFVIRAPGFFRNFTDYSTQGLFRADSFLECNAATMANDIMVFRRNTNYRSIRFGSTLPASLYNMDVSKIAMPVVFYISESQAAQCNMQNLPAGLTQANLRGIMSFPFDNNKCMVAFVDSSGQIFWQTSQP